MLDNQAAFYSSSGKRRILVVEDESVNRELLSHILEEKYEVLQAADGIEAMHRIEEVGNDLSLVLLDLIMPNMSGQEVLEWMKSSSDFRDIPVIVASSDQSQEIECLKMGASDFFQKPYPDSGIIMARVLRTIELYEDRKIIASTERDPLTGLYTREYFYSYAEQYDQHHKDQEMDAVVLNINRFAMIGERYGRAFADEVLCQVAQKAMEMVENGEGIVCRGDADNFQIYCPHREDYKVVLDNMIRSLAAGKKNQNRIRLRMGLYARADKSLDLQQRFDRARMASDTVRNSLTRNIGVYDDMLHQSELYLAQLIDDFPTAIEQKQFQVYYQPKFDIRFEQPLMSSAEALVRWQHPKLGLISPSVFVPLFEENGLVQTLDQYVWREAAIQIRRWKDELDSYVPISVNISRVDIFDPGIIEVLLTILDEADLEPGDLHLELTEATYAQDSEQITETVKRLRELGFVIDMDDFGTGYSSLNMLSELPIDVLKVDMKFIQHSLARGRNAHMMEKVVEIAKTLNALVLAEGVETEGQLEKVKELGCDVIQGYYFSPPVPAGEFRTFLLERKKQGEPGITEQEKARNMKNAGLKEEKFLLSRWSKLLSFPMRKATWLFGLLAFVAAIALFIADFAVNRGYRKMENASDQYILVQQAASDLEVGSDYLTENVRSFVVEGDLEFLEDFFEEAQVTKRRDNAVAKVETYLDKSLGQAYQYLSEALTLSNELMNFEYEAMRLVLDTGDYDLEAVPAVVREKELSQQEKALSAEEKRNKAIELVFGDLYMDYKTRIKENTSLCTKILIDASNDERIRTDRMMTALLTVQTIFTIVLLAIILVYMVFVSVWVRRPLTRMVELIKSNELIPPAGAEELRFVSETYNTFYEETQKTHDRLTYGTMHDALTGLYNRSAYNYMRRDMDMTKNALLLVDVDKFKSVNDTYGHDVGDAVLKRVAEVLKDSFRSTDLVFRLGGDEFVVIMVNVTSSIRDVVKNKVEEANRILQHPSDDLPQTSLSVGAAFGDRENPDGDIFKDADTALYQVKEAGRCGCLIY